MGGERTIRSWSLLTLLCVHGCFAFPGMEGETCTEQGLCGAGLVCEFGFQRCVDPVCLGGKCGDVEGVDCGGCGGTAQCQQNQCVVPGYVQIRSGTFTMGSPATEPDRGPREEQLSVTLTRDFWLKETEVTQREWEMLMGSNPSRLAACGANCPVENVSWFDAVDYVNALSRSEGLPECYAGTGESRTFAGLSCRGYRLPTEAEWEYAARAGTTGAVYGPLDAIAWHFGNSGGTTHAVRGKDANAWGLYDMIGNVFEWTHDLYGQYGTGAAMDPVGPSAGSTRVLRGGSWDHVAAYCRAANRNPYEPSSRDDILGFRPARSALP